MNQEIKTLLDNSLIEKEKRDYITEKFNEFTSIASEWSEKANSIIVTNESQIDLMKQAKEGRLLLKGKRIEIEKTRKSLKEQSLNEGRLIDNIAKALTMIVEPAEKHLELQEKFLEIQEKKRKDELKAERYRLISPYAEVLDPDTLQLDLITEEAFQGLLKYAKTALETKKEQEIKALEEAKAREKKEAEEKENLRLENERLKKEASLLLKEAEERHKAEAIERQKLIDIANQKQKELLQQEQKTKVLEKKIVENTNIATSKIEESFKKYENQEQELQVLKEKYFASKRTLETVLTFIIPDNCRKMVEKVLFELNNIKYTK